MPILRTKDFEPGVPVAVTLQTLEPREAPDNGYGAAFVFSSSAGSIYLTPEAARQVQDDLRALAIAPGEPIRIHRHKTSHGGSRFSVERDGDAGGHNARPAFVPPVQTYAAPAQPVAAPVAAAPTDTARMMACFLVALDAVNEAQGYAKAKGIGITFTSDNVTSAALSCFINACKGGR